MSLLEEASPEVQRLALAAVREWKALEFDAGFGWISGPAEYQGRGLPRVYERHYQQLKRGFATPPETSLGVSLGMVAPTVLAYGSSVVKQRYLARLHRVELVACQLFSEPAAGSDLAGIQTKAVRDGDSWLISGQKVWTSGAQFSDVGEVICRTDPTAPKHAGITAFLIDMHAPGVDVRPLRQMTGGAAFNEVFLDEVRVPDDHRLGDVGGGWRVAISTLMSERESIGGGGAAGGGGSGFARVQQLATWAGRAADPLIRQALADLYIGMTVARHTNRFMQSRVVAGRPNGAEGSIGKLMLTANQRRVSDLAGLLLGPRLVADTGEWGTYAWAEYVLSAPGVRIAGGTDEIQKNVIAERALGLPKDRSAE
ncbi:MAG TPA: acyl-CoA dehydrogenase family protein [Ilumatobacter sp.]|nr:acyl-CoA dehydrogenase family protein [Ilumatobacter sp.]